MMNMVRILITDPEEWLCIMIYSLNDVTEDARVIESFVTPTTLTVVWQVL